MRPASYRLILSGLGAALIGWMTPSLAGGTAEGAGSTFVAPVIANWASEYAKETGTVIRYQAIGSGAGIAKIKAGEVDFGASDKPLDPTELAKLGLCQFPIVIGGVVPVVNVPGIGRGKIKFTGALLADIFMGKVKRWDDPAIRATNPGLALPALPITIVHRSDGSGTTYNWVDFLAKTSPAWESKIGRGLTVNWPVGLGGNGNAGVAATVLQTKGAIGYVEYAYAIQNKLAYGQVENTHGLFISPSAETFQAAAETVDWRQHPDFAVLMTNAASPLSYPIAATTFILMYKTPKDPAGSAAALAFFKWALEKGDKQAEALDYVSLPPNLVLSIEEYWSAEIKPAREPIHS